MKHGKKYNDSRKAVDSAKQYASEEALSLVCTNAKAKFDETIEAHIRLGVDSRHADQQVRGAVVLPNGTGKKVRLRILQGKQVRSSTGCRCRLCRRSGSGRQDHQGKLDGL